MFILTMTPAYSILLSVLAFALMATIAVSVLAVLLQATWQALDAAYVKITKQRQ